MRGALYRLSGFVKGRDFSKSEAAVLNVNGDHTSSGGDAKAK